ncbi:hypothetical protein BBO99_00007251 [Phytophthora kernoviae]|uniref:carbonic anhydrase n=2 Tax=Phytophthora kernoviae TaxID=325452 RepID=A0A3R7JA61_9STRA|nr:hypothetical protein G195_008196 [Phytophthora kernoviae 00238/432]KAG2520327.1 hypothetical protein JM18_007156 [Phytophthora kernoviae]RLN26557.1 hypothetical protein BBI17_007552 [Phytophthora kernoviae]RLN76804.1 hypothetical protein BBO99_00007251 [Phytophthora kernoviae]
MEHAPLKYGGDCDKFTLKKLEDLYKWEIQGDEHCTVKSINFDEREYGLAQFHMHATSEHALDGYHYDAEIHFVHKDVSGSGKILVTGVFLHAEPNVEENSFIKSLWNDMKSEESTYNIEDSGMSYADLLNGLVAKSHLFNYNGSLTTPPCSEVVDWWVLNNPIPISFDELSQLKSAYEELPSTNSASDNRPTQSLNDRQIKVVLSALKLGYRHIDAAQLYHNEAEVGRAVRDPGIPHEDTFVPSKLFISDWGYQKTLAMTKASNDKLGLGYIDLYLLHTPGDKAARAETWRALEEPHELDILNGIGVFNFSGAHIDKLTKTAMIKPCVNQIEVHPWLSRPEVIKYCKNYDIFIEAYSPLVKGMKFSDPILVEITNKVNVSPAQVTVSFSLSNDFIPLPKSAYAQREKENFEAINIHFSPFQFAKFAVLDDYFVTDWMLQELLFLEQAIPPLEFERGSVESGFDPGASQTSSVRSSSSVGSMLPYFQKAIAAGYGILVMNPNMNTQLMVSSDGTVEKMPIRGSSNADEHCDHVWRNYIFPSAAHKVHFIAYGYGGVLVTQLIAKYRYELKSRLGNVAFIESSHKIDPSWNSGFKRFFSQHSISWARSDFPLNTELSRDSTAFASSGGPSGAATTASSDDAFSATSPSSRSPKSPSALQLTGVVPRVNCA